MRFKRGEVEGWRFAKLFVVTGPSKCTAVRVFPVQGVVAFVNKARREIELPVCDGDLVKIGAGEMEPLLHLAKGNVSGETGCCDGDKRADGDDVAKDISHRNVSSLTVSVKV